MADRRGSEYLQGVVAKTRATGLVNWPQLTKNDYELFGELTEAYSFIDFNLRRFMEVLDHADATPQVVGHQNESRATAESLRAM